ncbi:MAG: pentapeptide repeat-containing protein [Lentilitoribacter sp.]
MSGFDFELVGKDDELTFENCRLSNTRVTGDALHSSIWVNCKFQCCEFSGADLREARFDRCRFFDQNENKGVSFRFCNMASARFFGCNLALSILIGCNAYDITFKNCQMVGAKIETTDFEHVIGRVRRNKALFESCNMTDVVMEKLDLSSCEFVDCILKSAMLRRSRLVNTTLKSCDLIFTEIEDADFSGADLRGSKLDGFSLLEISGYSGMSITASEQHHLLHSLGIEVSPNED